MSNIAWTTIRDALQSWISTGSGLAGDHVVWRGQRDAAGATMPRPTGQYIELALLVVRRKGPLDIKRYSFNAGTNVLTQFSNGPRTATLRVTCYQGAPAGGTGAPSSTSCMAVLEDALAARGRDDVNEALYTAGVGVSTIETGEVAGDVVNDVVFEARAIAEIKLHLASEVSYVYPTNTGWIEIVNADGLPGDLSTVHVHVDS